MRDVGRTYNMNTAASQDRLRQKLHMSDLVWFLAYPLYQVIGTIRHEGSHAIVGILEGHRVKEFVFLPRFGGRPWVIWGYVRFDGQYSWLTSAAPYFCDIITFALAFYLLHTYIFKRHWVWMNVVAIGLFGPLINSVYNYTTLFYTWGDLNHLVAVLPRIVVHSYFLATIMAYVAGTIFVLLGARLRCPGNKRPTTE